MDQTSTQSDDNSSNWSQRLRASYLLSRKQATEWESNRNRDPEGLRRFQMEMTQAMESMAQGVFDEARQICRQSYDALRDLCAIELTSPVLGLRFPVHAGLFAQLSVHRMGFTVWCASDRGSGSSPELVQMWGEVPSVLPEPKPDVPPEPAPSLRPWQRLLDRLVRPTGQITTGHIICTGSVGPIIMHDEAWFVSTKARAMEILRQQIELTVAMASTIEATLGRPPATETSG